MALKKEYIYVFQIVFAGCVFLASQSNDTISWENTMTCSARFVVYFLIINYIKVFANIIYSIINKENGRFMKTFVNYAKLTHFAMVIICVGILRLYSERILEKNFLYFTMAYLIYKYPKMNSKKKSFISYGVGMACNYFEGYLVYILPNEGTEVVGFERNIMKYEATHRVVFPVKRLFLIITKNLYCPPDLADFNKSNKNLPYLEACQGLDELEKDVAGVKNRSYRNSAYMIHRAGGNSVYLAVECVTPLHTLQRVKEHRAQYEDLSDADFDKIVADFCDMLQSIIHNSHNCRNKCELIIFDDTDPSLNLAEILLKRIEEIEPDFENMKNN